MDRYGTIKQLGDGTYGSVLLAKQVDTGEMVAIKKMKKKYYSWDECLNLREVKSLRKLGHPNIVKLKEVIREHDHLYFVFEFMKENLYQMTKNRDKEMPEPTVRNIILQIMNGLAFMHHNGFFHRDLKPENLLCSGQECVKIADFGLAREVRSRPPYTDYVSTRWYRAPEVLLRSTNYSSPIDIFAIGCIMAELYTLRPLFPGSSEVDQIFKICSVLGTPTKSDWPEGMRLASQMNFRWPQLVATPLKKLIPNASPQGLQLLYDTLAWDPQKRPTAARTLKYPFFQVGKSMLPSTGQKMPLNNQRNMMQNRRPSYGEPQPRPAVMPTQPSHSQYGQIKARENINPMPPPAQPQPPMQQDGFQISAKKSGGRKRWGMQESYDDWDEFSISESFSKKKTYGAKKPVVAKHSIFDFDDDNHAGHAKPGTLPKLGTGRVGSGRSSATSSAKQNYMNSVRYYPGKSTLNSATKDSPTSRHRGFGMPLGKPNPIGPPSFGSGTSAYVPSFMGSASKQSNTYGKASTQWKRAEPALNKHSATRQPLNVTGRTDWASKYGK